MRTELIDFKQKLIGQDVYILGGGNSIRNFDFSKLENKIVIVLNSTIKKVKTCTAVLWADNDWGAKNLDTLDKFDCHKFSVRQFCAPYLKNNIKGIGGSTVLKKGGDFGYSSDINEVCGNNSGAQAINLVANTQPYRIILLGYDMGYVDGNSHCHDDYTMSQPSIYDEMFIPSINIMAPIIQKLGIEIINCSLKSKLKCFKKDDIENYL